MRNWGVDSRITPEQYIKNLRSIIDTNTGISYSNAESLLRVLDAYDKGQISCSDESYKDHALNKQV